MFITSIKFVQTIRAQVISLHRTNEKYQYQKKKKDRKKIRQTRKKL